MKKIKRMIAMLLVIVSVVVLTAVSASASIVGGRYSDSKSINHNGSYSTTSFNMAITFPNTVNNTRHVGYSSTRWMGSNPYNADSIVHKNIISVSSLGGISISSSGGGGSISGKQMIDEMSSRNTWQINSTFDYTIKASAVILSSNFAASGRVQIGSNYYSVSCST